METRPYLNRPNQRISIGVFLVLLLAWTSTSWAFPHNRERVGRLPRGNRSVWVDKKHIPYRGRTFYRRAPRGHVVVAAPIGAVVAYLPVGYTTLVIEGVPYYTYEDVYYRRVPSGYMVVESPPAVAVQTPPRLPEPPSSQQKRIVVAADRLNVRSGPGLEYPVVAQVLRGVVLDVRGAADGWWYAQLPNNTFGWVQSQFTTPSPEQPASG